MSKEILEITRILEKGYLTIFPTETVYGLAVRADNPKSIANIYTVKNRSSDKPLSIFIRNIKEIEKFITNLTNIQHKIINYFSPGAITFILPIKKKSIFSDWCCLSQNTIGIRIPNHPIALTILKHCKFPLAVTSVNISKEPSILTAINIPENIKKKVKIIINDDTLVKGLQSTIIDLTTDSPQVIRKGAIKNIDFYIKRLLI